MNTSTAIELLATGFTVLAAVIGGLWGLGRALRKDRSDAVGVATATEARTVRTEEAVKDLRHDVRGLDDRVRGLEQRRD